MNVNNPKYPYRENNEINGTNENIEDLKELETLSETILEPLIPIIPIISLSHYKRILRLLKDKRNMTGIVSSKKRLKDKIMLLIYYSGALWQIIYIMSTRNMAKLFICNTFTARSCSGILSPQGERICPIFNCFLTFFDEWQVIISRLWGILSHLSLKVNHAK